VFFYVDSLWAMYSVAWEGYCIVWVQPPIHCCHGA